MRNRPYLGPNKHAKGALRATVAPSWRARTMQRRVVLWSVCVLSVEAADIADARRGGVLVIAGPDPSIEFENITLRGQHDVLSVEKLTCSARISAPDFELEGSGARLSAVVTENTDLRARVAALEEQLQHLTRLVSDPPAGPPLPLVPPPPPPEHPPPGWCWWVAGCRRAAHGHGSGCAPGRCARAGLSLSLSLGLACVWCVDCRCVTE